MSATETISKQLTLVDEVEEEEEETPILALDRVLGPAHLNPWYQRLRDALVEAPSHAALVGGASYGVPLLLRKMRDEGLLGYIQLSLADVNSKEAALASRFAHAVNEAYGLPVLPSHMTLAYVARLMRQRVPSDAPLMFGISHAELALPLIDALVAERAHVRLVLDFASAPQAGWAPPETRLFRTTETAIGTDELSEWLTNLAHEGLWRQPADATVEEEAKRLMRLTGGQYAMLAGHLFGGTHVSAATRGLFEGTGPDALLGARRSLEAARANEDWVSALEIAVAAAPEEVPELVQRAGPIFQERGTLAQLFLLLEGLDRARREDSHVLEWRLLSAHESSNSAYQSILLQAREHLQEHPAPNLRTRVASTYMGSRAGVAMAQDAMSMDANALTVWNASRLEPRADTALRLAGEALVLAQSEGSAYAIVRNLGQLADALLRAGRYQEARERYAEALSAFDQNGLSDGIRRMRLLIDNAQAGWMTGEARGMARVLEEEAATMADSVPSGVSASVLWRRAELLFVSGDIQAAKLTIDRALALAHSESLPAVGSIKATAVRIYQELGLYKEARTLAYRDVDTTRAWPSTLARAHLALGMALAYGDEDDRRAAEQELLAAREAEHRWHSAFDRLSIELWLAFVQKRSVSEAVKALAKGLSMRAVLLAAGPLKDFQGVLQSFDVVRQHPLYIRAFGNAQMWVHGNSVALTKREWDAVLILAMKGRALTPDELYDAMAGDGDLTKGSLKTLMSRLRKKLGGVVSTSPYRLTESYFLDLEAVHAHLNSGEVMKAIDIARGDLLPHSDAPAVVTERGAVKAALHAAVIKSDDPQVVFTMWEAEPDDIKLLERTLEMLPERDPRRYFVEAHLRQIEIELGAS